MSELNELNKYMLYPKNMVYCLKEIVEQRTNEKYEKNSRTFYRQIPSK